ncbi:hypothetical protein [Nostoc linckia]|uniref:hypothetical protein n=1 Tax=Nostoc linckia TaxID=92942 RepID=UPI001C557353|nr:hypothetical protein [Nostoc linckia]
MGHRALEGGQGSNLSLRSSERRFPPLRLLSLSPPSLSSLIYSIPHAQCPLNHRQRVDLTIN